MVECLVWLSWYNVLKTLLNSYRVDQNETDALSCLSKVFKGKACKKSPCKTLKGRSGIFGVVIFCHLLPVIIMVVESVRYFFKHLEKVAISNNVGVREKI